MHPANNVSWPKLSIFLFGIALAILLLNLTGGMAKKAGGHKVNNQVPPVKANNMSKENGSATTPRGKSVPPTKEKCDTAGAKTACERAHVLDMKKCMDSVVVQQTCKVPKHLRPPWKNPEIQKGAPESAKTGAWYACDDGTKTRTEPYCACAYKMGPPNPEIGAKIFAKPNLNGECLDQFYQVAMMPMCGNEWYDHVKHCAFVQFYDNKTSEPEEGKAEMHTLVLLDGCIVADKDCTAKFKVEFTEPDGSFFTKCSQETKTVYDDNKDQAAGTKVVNSKAVGPNMATFTVPMQFIHRRCKSLFSDDAIESFKDIKLTVSGCDAEKTFKLPNLDGNKGRVQEMRGLEVNLKEGKVRQWRAKTPADTEFAANEGEGELMWAPTDMSQIGTHGKPTTAFYK